MTKSYFVLDCHALSRWSLAGVIPALLDNPTVWRDDCPVTLDDVRRTIEQTARDIIATQLRRRIAREFPSIANAMYDIAATGSLLADWQAPFWARVDGLAVDFEPVKRCPASRLRPELPDYPAFLRLVGDCVGAAVARLPSPDIPPDFVASYLLADARLSARPDLLREAIASRESAILARYQAATEETKVQRRRRTQTASILLQNARKIGLPLPEFARLVGMEGATPAELRDAVGGMGTASLYRIRREIEYRGKIARETLALVDKLIAGQVKSQPSHIEEWH